MDWIIIDSLELKTTIGVHAWEQACLQTLKVNLSISIDTKAAAQSDNLNDTIDYEALCNHLDAWALDKKTLLIEKFANDLADKILNTFPVSRLMLSLTKTNAVKQAKSITISLMRERQ